MNLKIRTQLSLYFALIVASLILFFSINVYIFSSEYRHSQFMSRLEEKANTTAKLLFEVEQVDSLLLKIIESADQTILFHEKLVIFNHENQVIFDSKEDLFVDYPTDLFSEIRLKQKVILKNDSNEMIGIVYKENDNEYIVIASAYDFFGFKKLKNLIQILLINFILSIIFITILGWFFANKALSPILKVIEKVSSITSNNLHLRLNEGNKSDEIAMLSNTFNEMLERLEAAFIAQKDFVSNASHELRTPLTAIKSEIDVSLLSDRSNEDYKKTLKSLSDDIHNISDLINGLLILAQTNTDFSRYSFVHQRIDEILWQARKLILTKQPHYNVLIDFKTEPQDENQLILHCNYILLRTAFINLIENACKFSDNSTCQVSINFETNRIFLEFIDNGIGICIEDHENIFKPFYRGQNSNHVYGHGIGLSLVDNIIKIHNGSIELISEVNKGSIFKITLPT